MATSTLPAVASLQLDAMLAKAGTCCLCSPWCLHK